MNTIRFKYSPQKAIEVIRYILSKKGDMDKLKLMKLLYIAERDHFLAHHRPITGDRLFSLPHGPVPSKTLNLVDGELSGFEGEVYNHIALEGVKVRNISQNPIKLEPTEIAILDSVLLKYGDLTTYQIKQETHRFPEYNPLAAQRGTSYQIEYENLLRLYGSEEQFLYSRPVISLEMSRHLDSPIKAKSEQW